MPNRTKYTEDMVIRKKIGKLFVTGPSIQERTDKGKLVRKIKCKCDCGNEKYMNLIQLCTGKVVSCGCVKNNVLGEARHLGLVKSKCNTKDGRTGTRLYSIWGNMNSRCTLPSCDNYKYYGGRGIEVCYNWSRKNPYGWENFKNWAYMNGFSEDNTDLEIDRIDHDGNYEPSNCRFATRAQQVINKSDNVFITYGDITKTVGEWSTALMMDRSTIMRRYHSDWTDSEILSIPPLLMNQLKDQYIKEHGIRPYIIINDPLYEAKYQKPFFDNEVLKTPLP